MNFLGCTCTTWFNSNVDGNGSIGWQKNQTLYYFVIEWVRQGNSVCF